MLIRNPAKRFPRIQEFPFRSRDFLSHIDACPEHYRHPLINIFFQKFLYRCAGLICKLKVFSCCFFKCFQKSFCINPERIFIIGTSTEIFIRIRSIKLSVSHFHISAFQTVLYKFINSDLISQILKEHHRRHTLTAGRIFHTLVNIRYLNFMHVFSLRLSHLKSLL